MIASTNLFSFIPSVDNGDLSLSLSTDVKLEEESRKERWIEGDIKEKDENNRKQEGSNTEKERWSEKERKKEWEDLGRDRAKEDEREKRENGKEDTRR